MRLGVAWEKTNNAYYRAVFPMQAMERRGHEVRWPRGQDMEAHLRELHDCDVVHVYRRANRLTRRELTRLSQAGVAITYDNDDDFTAVPKESPLYKQTGGLEGQRIFRETAQAGQLAQAMTTPSEVLAGKYRQAGVEPVAVVENAVARALAARRPSRGGVVIGWVAGVEHRADAARLDIAGALDAVLSRHPDARVECIGVDLRLTERYRHDGHVPFLELPARLAGWDIGIAPLADIPYNHTRSNIKVKEYAASGIPWLASPIGGYTGLGEAQGGRLVADGEWAHELDRLVSSRRDRKRLARDGARWAREHTIDAIAPQWERVFLAAAAAGGAAARRRG